MGSLNFKKYFISLVLVFSFVFLNAQTKKTTKETVKKSTPASSSNADKNVKKEKYSIKVKVNGIKDTVCYLANYYGDKQYLKDTARVDKKGNFTFEGNTKLEGGIYLIVLPGNKYFETIIVNEQDFSLETDTGDFVTNMKIKNSNDNTIFYEYLQYVNIKGNKVEEIKKNIKTDSINVTKQLIEIDKEVTEYRKMFMDKYKSSFVVKIFNATNEIVIPENPNPKDSNYAYYYYRKHYFDNIDWTDDNILRTPIFHSKLEKYINKVIPQAPDSMIVELDKLIAKAEVNKELFKYCVWYATNNSEQSKIMGMDALTMHLYKKYYLTGKAYWIDKKTSDKIKEQVEIKDPLLLGKVIPDAYLKDSTDTYRRLWDVKADYTVVFFYDPNCGHCQKEAPKLYEYFMKHKGQVMVYAASIERKDEDWKKFIVKNKYTDWLNVWDKGTHTDFRKTYDVFSTPVIYILDKNKRIIAKRLGADQIEDFIENHKKGKIK